MYRYHRKGFTLIEMLVVIAIVAILVAVIVPAVSNATIRAKASTDAANLRTILGEANSRLVGSEVEVAAAASNMTYFNCATFSGGKAYIYYVTPGFIIAYFENNGSKYTIDSFSEAASTGNPPVATELPAGGTAYPVGGNGGN